MHREATQTISKIFFKSFFVLHRYRKISDSLLSRLTDSTYLAFISSLSVRHVCTAFERERIRCSLFLFITVINLSTDKDYRLTANGSFLLVKSHAWLSVESMPRIVVRFRVSTSHLNRYPSYACWRKWLPPTAAKRVHRFQGTLQKISNVGTEEKSSIESSFYLLRLIASRSDVTQENAASRLF